MSDYFDRLELELRAAVPRAAGDPAPQRARRWHVPGGVLAIATSAAVVAAVLVFALAVRNHGSGSHGGLASAGQPRSAPARAPARRTTAVARLQAILSQYAILRRPQIGLDLSVAPAPQLLAGTRLIPRFTRSAGMVGGANIVVGVSMPRPPGSPTEALEAVIWRQGVNGRAGRFSPFAGRAAAPLPLAFARQPRTGVQLISWVSLVPDEVTSVRWVFRPTTARPPQHADRSPITVTPSVEHNVAAAVVPGTDATDSVAVTWYGAGGRVIASARASGTSGSTTPRGGPTVKEALAGDGIGTVAFGASLQEARTGTGELLGSAAARYSRYTAGCGLDHILRWVLPAPAADLTLYFRRGRFVGYQYFNGGTRSRPRLQTHGVVLATASGLRIGDSLARGRKLYGSAFTISAAQGGSWSVAAPAGRLMGYADPVPRGDGADSSVATIAAGDLGCSALTP